MSLWQRRAENGWATRPAGSSRDLIGPRTKLIYINTPHNPTGIQMPRTTFERVIELARERDAVLFSDEVYRGLEHDEADRLPAACDVYERATPLKLSPRPRVCPGCGSAGAVCRDPDVLRRMRELKLYTTICSSAPSELLVALALRHSEARIVQESRGLIAEKPAP